MKYKGIIFDLDGVLCSTDRFHFEAWKQTAEEVGAPFDETINMKLRGVSRMESLEIILSGSSKTCGHTDHITFRNPTVDKSFRESFFKNACLSCGSKICI